MLCTTILINFRTEYVPDCLGKSICKVKQPRCLSGCDFDVSASCISQLVENLPIVNLRRQTTTWKLVCHPKMTNSGFSTSQDNYGAKHSPLTQTSRLAFGSDFRQALKIDIQELHLLQGVSFDNVNQKRARTDSAEYMKKIIVQILALNAFGTLVSKKFCHSLKCMRKSIFSQITSDLSNHERELVEQVKMLQIGTLKL